MIPSFIIFTHHEYIKIYSKYLYEWDLALNYILYIATGVLLTELHTAANLNTKEMTNTLI